MMKILSHQSTDHRYQEYEIQEKLYVSLVKENLHAIALVDHELRFLITNAAFCAMLGLPGEDYLKNFHISVLPFSDNPNFNTFLKGLVTNEIPRFEIETTFKSMDNCTKTLKLKMVGNVVDSLFIGGTLILEDITQTSQKKKLLEKTISNLKQHNQYLQDYIKSNLQLENFAWLASHDLKEPLRMIGNFSQLLEKKYAGNLDEEGLEYLKYILDGVRNMDMFINDLLSYSKLDKETDFSDTINLRNLIFLVSRELQNQIEEKGANVIFDEVPEYIVGCKEKIMRLFFQIISNAIKFCEESEIPQVKISGEEQDDYWQFKIEDNGIGIKEEYFEKIFLLFKRLHPRNAYKGSGIGLATCKKIVEQHGGEIWVESEFTKGSTFYFTINKPKKESDKIENENSVN